MEIKVLGTGCAKCKTLYQETEKALARLSLPATLSKVDKIEEIMAFHVLMTPALVINGQVKAAGRIPTQAELASWITTAAAAE
jgi:small redox-active disulfide protein 2